MNGQRVGRLMHVLVATCFLCAAVNPAFAGLKKWAVIAPSGSKLDDVSFADIVQLCKGAQKAWPDGKNFTIVIHDPDAPEMRGPIQTLFGVAPSELKILAGKVNQSHVVIKIVDSDEDLLRTVVATPGAIGLVDVYAINSSVKVLRIDGKLPFDPGYVLKSN